jgi:hypothetical protein
MNTAKVYKDTNGEECNIHQMIKREPYWAANRIQEGEKAIEKEKELLKAAKMAYRKHCHNDDSIGWEELSDMLSDTLSNVLGIEEYLKFQRECEKWA